MKRICVDGVGYDGLVTADRMADLGNRVITLYMNEIRNENLKNGIMPFYEPVERRALHLPNRCVGRGFDRK